MKTEKEKMLSGELYDPRDKQLCDERLKARLLLKELNDTREDQVEKRKAILKTLIPDCGVNLWLQPPFYCDYGYNIKIGDNVFLNFNCVILDVMEVKIGSRTLLGPNVQVYSATHPMDHNQRASGLELAKPIVIGEDVWIGGVVIAPVLSLEIVVSSSRQCCCYDIPSDVFAGNPCKIIRHLSPAIDHNC